MKTKIFHNFKVLIMNSYTITLNNCLKKSKAFIFNN